jgi:hypothetical protein
VSGRLILMGSGELAPRLVATHRDGIEAAGADRVTILDTPFGFQENAPQLTARLVDFFETSLRIEAEVASLPAPGASPLEVEQMLATVRRSRYVFAGPGSPSYALRVWSDTDLASALSSVVTSGGTVTFASAAALTLGMKTIPVYEIYKVGEDPYWLEGLGVSALLGLPAVIVPHWNNAEGGNHDTSRCYIGERRLGTLEAELDTGIIGIDEHTAAALDFGHGTLRVTGVGGVVLRGAEETHVASGDTVALDEAARRLGAVDHAVSATQTPRLLDMALAGAVAAGDADAAVSAILHAEEAAAADQALRGVLRSMVVELGRAAEQGMADPRAAVSPFVDLLLDLRERARTERRFGDADFIRDRLSAAGVDVRDTPEGVIWERTG